MALAFAVNFTIVDQKNKSSVTKIRIPTGLTIAQMVEFAQDAAQVIANANTGRITFVSISAGLDLTGHSLKTIVTLFADIAEKALFTFNSAVSGLFARFNIPTLDETNVVLAGTDVIDTTDPDIAAYIAGIEDGITLTDASIMQPVDKYGNDLLDSRVEREIFRKKRR